MVYKNIEKVTELVEYNRVNFILNDSSAIKIQFNGNYRINKCVVVNEFIITIIII